MDLLFRRLRPVGALVAAAALVAVAGASAQSQDTRVLRVSKEGEGVVRTAKGRINCGTRCSARFTRRARVTLTAAPARYFSFQRWTGGCVGTAPRCVVLLDRATATRAVFARKSARLALAVSGPGNVTSDPAGFSCGTLATDCARVAPEGIPVTLTAAPEEEATLGGWGGPCRQAGSGACRLVPEGDVEVTASFRPDIRSPDPESLFVSVGGETRVLSEPPGIDCPDACDAEFPSGTIVTLRASRAQTWEGTCVGVTTECVLFLDDTGDVDASSLTEPASAKLALNVTVSGGGAVRGGEIRCGNVFGAQLDCDALYDRGAAVILRAVGRRRARFGGWFGACGGRKRTCSLVVTAPQAVSAAFGR
jgi:hypothetical protein